MALRQSLLRARTENLIKLHKTQLASDRTSCRSAIANQVRLVLHTAAYWLMLAVRDAIPKARDLASAEFATLRLRLIKIAARITESAARVRVAFATACPDAALFASLARCLQPETPVCACHDRDATPLIRDIRCAPERLAHRT